MWKTSSKSLRRDRVEVPSVQDGGRVDQRVDASEAIDRPRDDRLGRLGRAEVDDERLRVGAERPDLVSDRLDGVAPVVDEAQPVVAGLGQEAGDRRPETAAGPGHDGDPFGAGWLVPLVARHNGAPSMAMAVAVPRGTPIGGVEDLDGSLPERHG